MNSSIICPECGHDAEDHWYDQLHGIAGCVLECECSSTPRGVYLAVLGTREGEIARLRAALSESDAQLARAEEREQTTNGTVNRVIRQRDLYYGQILELAEFINYDSDEDGNLEHVGLAAQQQLAEARRERNEAQRTLRTELAGYDRMACELGTSKRQRDALAADLREADAVIEGVNEVIEEFAEGHRGPGIEYAQEAAQQWRERTKAAAWRTK